MRNSKSLCKSNIYNLFLLRSLAAVCIIGVSVWRELTVLFWTCCLRNRLLVVLGSILPFQCAKKVVSDSLGLVDFAIGVVNSFINLPDGQMKFFDELKLQKNCEVNLRIKTFLGLVEMMFGLVNVSFSLPEWQAVKMIFFASCIYTTLYQGKRLKENLLQ